MNKPGATAPSAAHDADRNVRAGASLTSLCFEEDEERLFRRMVWTLSVAALFLAVGLFGFWRPHVLPPRGLTLESYVPVVLFEPEREQPTAVATATPPSGTVEPKLQPQVVPVVAPFSSEIAFPVPVKEAAVLVPVRAATPVATQVVVAPQSTQFDPGTSSAVTPQPEYPKLALQRSYQGTVIVNFTVEPSGDISTVELAQSSGFRILDDAAMDTIRKRWRFEPGPRRYHFVPIIFRINNR